MQAHTPPAASSTIVPSAVTDAALTGVSATFASPASLDEQLVGAEITFNATLIGHVEGLVRDPLTQRIRGLITSYGLKRRRVAVPMEWVVKRSSNRLELGVSARSLDDLGDRVRP